MSGQKYGCRPDPKAALDGEASAARHRGQRLGDGAAQLKTATSAGRRAATGYYCASDVEPRAALGESCFRKRNEQEQKNNFHGDSKLFLCERVDYLFQVAQSFVQNCNLRVFFLQFFVQGLNRR